MDCSLSELAARFRGLPRLPFVSSLLPLLLLLLLLAALLGEPLAAAALAFVFV